MLQTILSTILFVGTAIVLLSPQVPLIRKVSEYSVHIMLGMLLFSMLSMVRGKSKVMFAGLACTAALCIFLKNASHSSFLADPNKGLKLNVAHINLGNVPYEIDSIKNMLIIEDVDVVSFQEFTPDWNDILEEELDLLFPHFRLEMRMDLHGLAIFSKEPFVSDIFMCNGIPSMNVEVMKGEVNFQIISSYLTPALDNKSLKKAAHQLETIANKIKESQKPLIALGEYNMVYWTNEIRSFRAKTNLQNSRRDLIDGNLRVPYDHIFFSEALECTHFKEMKDDAQNYIGIMGTYQIKEELEVVDQDPPSQLSYIDSEGSK